MLRVLVTRALIGPTDETCLDAESLPVGQSSSLETASHRRLEEAVFRVQRSILPYHTSVFPRLGFQQTVDLPRGCCLRGDGGKKYDNDTRILTGKIEFSIKIVM